MKFRRSSIAPLLTWATGMVMLFHAILFSGLRTTFHGLGDLRLVNFTLEHTYRWMAGFPIHADFWSPPLFFPHENVAAYTDLLAGVAAPYMILRALEVGPVPSFLLWVFIMWTLNFVAAYFLMRRVFSIEALSASLGAFLFAFGNPRSANIGHQQLQPAFYLLTAFAALVVIFASSDVSDRCRRGWMAAFYAALLLQAYTSFYPLYFFCMCLLVAAVWGLAMREYRERMLRVIRQDWWAILTGGLLAVAASVPMLIHYMRAAGEVGLREFRLSTLPTPASWLLMGSRHPWYGWLQTREGPFFHLRRPMHSNGVGLATTMLAIIGLYWAWKRRSVRLLVLVVSTVIVVTTVYPGGYSGWLMIYDYVPGAAALRAVARIGMITLLPLSLGIAMFFARLEERRRWVLLALFAVVVVAEQSHDIRVRERQPVEVQVASLAERVRPGCEAFLLVYVGESPYGHVHTDAAWVAIATGVPTLNGRYGSQPPEYGLDEVQIANQADRDTVRRAMADWIELKGLPGPRVCLIETRTFVR